MENLAKISCAIDTTDAAAALGLEIWVDDQCVFDSNHVTSPLAFEHDISDDEARHCLKFVMKGKKPEHTSVSDSGEILKDARLIVKDIAMGEILLGHTVVEKAIYTHDFNGTAGIAAHKFYGEMGCNGIIELEFSTPIYMWLLENM